MSAGSRKKPRSELEESRTADSLNASDLDELRMYLQREELALRVEAKTTLNKELIERIEACKGLVEQAVAQDSFSAALEAGVVSQVQEGIYQNVHAMTVGSSDALHRMLALEKEHAQMRTKCTDEAVWQRYKAVLEDNQMHGVCKAAMEMQSELMLIGSSLLNNLGHLRADLKDEKMMY